MSVRSATIWAMSGQYLTFAVNFAVSVIISRFFLTPEEVGVFSVALSLAMMATLLHDFGITRYIAGEKELADERVAACFTVALAFTSIVVLVILALAVPAAEFYDDARLTPLLLIVAFSYVFLPFAIVPNALLHREMDFRSLFLVNVGSAAAGGGAALALAAAGWSAFALAWGAVASQAVRALVATWRCRREIGLGGSLAAARPVLRFGGGASLLYASGALGTRSPDLIVGRMLTMAAVGLFSRADALAAQLRMLASDAAAGVFFTAFARLRDRGEDLAGPYLRVVAGYTGLAWPAMAFLAASAVPLVLLLYGPVWAGVAPLLFWIALAQMVLLALPLHIDLPILAGRMRTLIKVNYVDTAISIGTLILGAWIGLEAAAGSRLAYAALWFLLYFGWMRRLAGFRTSALVLVYLRSAAATLATIAPLLAIYTFWKEPAACGFGELAAAAALAGPAWLATIFLVRHPIRNEILGAGQDLLVTLRRRPA